MKRDDIISKPPYLKEYDATNLHSHDQHTHIRHATYFYNILPWLYLGAMIGLFVTSICLSIWTEVGSDPPQDISGTDDPNWVGAWWIMFTVGFGLTLLCSLPMFGFPKQLPGVAEIRYEESGRKFHDGKAASSDETAASSEEIVWRFFYFFRFVTIFSLCVAVFAFRLFISDFGHTRKLFWKTKHWKGT